MIIIVDYGLGNLGSVENMLRRLGATAAISGDPSIVAQADKLILPGVGAFDQGITNLRARALAQTLQERVIERRVPILGICLGLQLMTTGSEEGQEPGLAWLETKTVRFQTNRTSSDKHTPIRVPHMAWNEVRILREDVLFGGLHRDARFYFVHSYHLAESPETTIAVTTHGYEFPCAARRDNIAGVQFHPEKSHRFGLALLKNFAETEQ